MTRFRDRCPYLGERGVHGAQGPYAIRRTPYRPDFRRMVELVRSGCGPDELAEKFNATAEAIRNTVAHADRGLGRRHDGVTTEEREELTGLRRAVMSLCEEREILKRAAVWFVREIGSIQPEDSSS